MKYLSICSGIEAASVAWSPLGFKPVAFAEIEKFPSAVLAHHYPETPNRGDMTKFNTWPDDSINILVGGTPCQSFSVAGLRAGLNDPRGNLTLTFLAMARRFRPDWIVWENVPGVLSDRTNAFGQFLAGLGELGYGFAYRVLDAQFFGVAQRRRRVFVVASLGGWQRAAAVLFEREGLRGNYSTRSQTREEITGTLSARTQGGGGLGTDFDLAGGLQIAPTLNAAFGNKQGLDNQHIDGGGDCSLPNIARCLTGSNCRQDAESETLLPTRRGGFPSEAATSFNWKSGGDCRGLDLSEKPSALTKNQTPATLSRLGVRRLTPRECERLQGFPDDYTAIPYKRKPADRCPDGPRYKALGNSMAVPVMRWIGQRILSEQNNPTN